jgi:hypothetical protein
MIRIIQKTPFGFAVCLVWALAFLAGTRASAQQCSSGGCARDGIGLDHYGVVVLGSCGNFGYCYMRDCAAFYEFDDANGVHRCAFCFQDQLFGPLVSPQSSMACITFLWETIPPCVCPREAQPQC